VPVANATSYTWTLPNGWTGTSTTESISLFSGNSGGIISVSANNACGTSQAQTLTITVNSAPASPAAINGPTDVCAGSSDTYSVASVNGATSYTWTLPNGWSGTSTTNTIVTTAGVNGGAITVSANNSCGQSSPVTLAVTVHNPVTPTITVNGADLVSSSSSGNQWYFEGSIISGATNQTYTVPQNGHYFVIYTDSYGCSVSSDTINYYWVSIIENAVELNLSIYPNPNNGMFTLDWTGALTGNVKIEIYSSLGELIYSKEMVNNSKPFQIDLLNAKPGVYFLKTTENKSGITRKLVIE
jgi:hypothetical protein